MITLHKHSDTHTVDPPVYWVGWFDISSMSIQKQYWRWRISVQSIESSGISDISDYLVSILIIEHSSLTHGNFVVMLLSLLHLTWRTCWKILSCKWMSSWVWAWRWQTLILVWRMYLEHPLQICSLFSKYFDSISELHRDWS